jgi:hypothetical protein
MSEFPAWLEGARSAPSSYNTQPWRFVVQSNGDVLVGWEPQRALPAADPSNRNLYIGLGAAVECARLRAAAARRPLDFVPAPDSEPDVVGLLRRASGRADEVDIRLGNAVPQRRTARTPHLRFPVPPLILLALRRETVGWGCRLHIVTERSQMRRLASLARRATAAHYADREAQAELFRWLRLDPGHAAYRRDGLTEECLELKGFSLAIVRRAASTDGLSWPAGLAVNHLLAFRAWRVVRQTAAMCLLTAPSADRADMVRAGRLLTRLWLLGTEAGLNAHPLSSILDLEATAASCLQVFGAQGGVPAALFRLGFCPPVPGSPRLPAGELLVKQESTSSAGVSD